MNQTDKMIFDLLGRALFNADFTLSDNINWSKLYNDAKFQTVAALIFDCLKSEEKALLPLEIKSLWEKHTFTILCIYEQLTFQQSRVIKLLKENNIPVAILKGSSAAINYKNPSVRTMGDIDLLVSPQNQIAAVKILQANGYGEVKDQNHPCHMTLYNGKIAVEVHKEPNGIHFVKDTKIKSKMHSFFADVIESIKIQDDFPILDDKHQAVVLLLHKLEHFMGSGLGLRQLCDWATFVDKKMTDELWHQLEPTLKSFGMLSFTVVITRICVDYLHLDVSKASWCLEADQRLCEDVLNRILQSGNFGQKENDYGEHFFIDFNSNSRLVSFIKVLTATCKRNWNLCNKYPILLPVAPFIVYFKYLKLKKSGKKPVVNMLKSYKNAGSKKQLFKELKPFESLEE